MYVCNYVCIYVITYVYVYVHVHVDVGTYGHMHVCMYACNICMDACMYVYYNTGGLGDGERQLRGPTNSHSWRGLLWQTLHGVKLAPSYTQLMMMMVMIM